MSRLDGQYEEHEHDRITPLLELLAPEKHREILLTLNERPLSIAGIAKQTTLDTDEVKRIIGRMAAAGLVTPPRTPQDSPTPPPSTDVSAAASTDSPAFSLTPRMTITVRDGKRCFRATNDRDEFVEVAIKVDNAD